MKRIIGTIIVTLSIALAAQALEVGDLVALRRTLIDKNRDTIRVGKVEEISSVAAVISFTQLGRNDKAKELIAFDDLLVLKSPLVSDQTEDGKIRVNDTVKLDEDRFKDVYYVLRLQKKEYLIGRAYRIEGNGIFNGPLNHLGLAPRGPVARGDLETRLVNFPGEENFIRYDVGFSVTKGNN